MIRIVRASSHREMPWKNGGGVTTEVAIYPPGASLDAFDWRVSMATMARSGPFSPFPGIERRLCLLDGRGLHLSIEIAQPPLTMMATRSSEPLVFNGDLPVEAKLVDGMVTILNVMTRRGRVRQDLERLRLDGEEALDLAAPIALLLCRDGQASVSMGEGMETLRHDDVAVVAAASGRRLALAGRASIYRIEIWPTA